MIFDGRRPASNPFAAALAALSEGDVDDGASQPGAGRGAPRRAIPTQGGAVVRRAGKAADGCACGGRSALRPVRGR